MPNQKKRYFLAVIPPLSIADEITEFKKEIEENYGANHALNAPPHITLIPPFETEEIRIQQFENALVSFLQLNNQTDIEIKLEGFLAFDYRTLFIDVAKNKTFELFCKEVKSLFNEQKIIPQRIEKHFFIPHITIANKDLKKNDFKKALEFYRDKPFKRFFKLSKLQLLKLDEKTWKIESEITL